MENTTTDTQQHELDDYLHEWLRRENHASALCKANLHGAGYISMIDSGYTITLRGENRLTALAGN